MLCRGANPYFICVFDGLFRVSPRHADCQDSRRKLAEILDSARNKIQIFVPYMFLVVAVRICGKYPDAAISRSRQQVLTTFCSSGQSRERAAGGDHIRDLSNSGDIDSIFFVCIYLVPFTYCYLFEGTRLRQSRVYQAGRVGCPFAAKLLFAERPTSSRALRVMRPDLTCALPNAASTRSIRAMERYLGV